MNKNEFWQAVANLNITFDEHQQELLDLYFKELIAYNEKVNLTAITKEEDVYLKHFYDSLTIIKIIDLNKITTVLDIGSGAGFPGIVLKIFFPHLKVTLIDSNNKKTTFLEYIKDKLQLTDVMVIHDRVENYSINNLNSFDLVTARAVTQLNILAELALPLVKEEKYFVTMKGDISREIVDGEYAIKFLGGKILNSKTFFLKDEANQRTLLLVTKEKKTNPTSIRPYEKIVKKPLQKRS